MQRRVTGGQGAASKGALTAGILGILFGMAIVAMIGWAHPARASLETSAPVARAEQTAPTAPRALGPAPASLAPAPSTTARAGSVYDTLALPALPPPSFATKLVVGSSHELPADVEHKIVARARRELELVTTYDASWQQTSGYPMGDIPQNRGACTDVVVRSLREVGLDLQKLVHDDVAWDTKRYGLTTVDTNIDHRRVGTMFAFFARNAMSLPTDATQRQWFRPGDIVFFAWSRGALAEHVGIVSDRIGPRGYPLVIQNGGPKPVESDSLDRGRIVGHFRALPH